MSVSRDFFGTQHPFAEAEHAALYHSLGGLLRSLLVRQFGVPEDEARSLVHEAFIGYSMRNLPLDEARPWLIGAACTHANEWRARRGLPPENEAEIARTTEKRLSHRDGLALLSARTRKALRLRFEEKKDYPEIAAELDLSTFAAKHFVARGMAELRKLLRG